MFLFILLFFLLDCFHLNRHRISTVKLLPVTNVIVTKTPKNTKGHRETLLISTLVDMIIITEVNTYIVYDMKNWKWNISLKCKMQHIFYSQYLTDTYV